MRTIPALVLSALLSAAAPAEAQVLGTFNWQLQPYGSVLTLTITQKGSLLAIEGFEAQCGGNLSLPVTGLAVPQANGQFFFGVTSINENGRGLHTRAFMNTTNFNGTWSDNAGNTNQAFVFRSTTPGPVCPGGPRTGPTAPDQGVASGDTSAQALVDEMTALRARLAVLEGRKP